MDVVKHESIEIEVIEVSANKNLVNDVVEVDNAQRIIVEVVEVVGIQGPPGGSLGLMTPDPREYFLMLLGGGIPDIPDEPDEPEEPDYTQPILGSAKLNTMVLA